MNQTVIARCTYADVIANPDLIAEYAVESALSDLGYANPQDATYTAMEAAGVLHFIGAFRDDRMVGFISIIVSVLPHFGVRVGTSESYFVASHARKGGTGNKLRDAAEALAAELGAIGLFISAPIDSRLDRVLPGSGYKPTHNIYYKGFPCSQP